MNLRLSSWVSSIGRGLAACCLLAVLCACGPGVVGTGTGAEGESGAELPFTEQTVCSAPFEASGLACSQDAEAGTAPVRWADASANPPGAAVQALVNMQSLFVQVTCTGTEFFGTWGRLEDGSLAFVGSYIGRGEFVRQPGLVRIEAAPDADGAVGRLRLEDVAGATLAGPWLLRRVEGGDVGLAACPP